MTKNTPAPAYQYEYTDAAAIHLEGANGLLYFLQSIAEEQAKANLSSKEQAAILGNLQILLHEAIGQLNIDQDAHGSDWSVIIQMILGVKATAKAMQAAHLEQCDMANHHIQIAALFSNSELIKKALEYLQENCSKEGA
jgi:hypothetical protein